jgi:DNA-binding beta-propeller fold protein YncE
LRTACLTIVVLFGFVALTCDEDCPVCPKEPEPPPEGNYRLYGYDSFRNVFFAFDIPADTIVDSVSLGFNPADLDVAPEGSRIFLPDYINGDTKVLNAADLSQKQIIPRIGQFSFDPKGNYLICSFGGYTVFLDPVSYMPVDSVALSIRGSFLDTLNNWYFGLDLDSMWFYRVDCLTYSIIDTIKIRLPGGMTVGIYEFAYNWLTNDLYFHAKTIDEAYFMQYSMDSDSLIASMRIWGPFGGVAISPDGRTVYMTDGGNGIHGIIPPGFLWIIDAKTHQVRDLIAPFIHSGSLIARPTYGGIAVPPDGRRVYLEANGNGLTTLPIIDVDLLERKMVRGFPYYDGMFIELDIGMIPSQ